VRCRDLAGDLVGAEVLLRGEELLLGDGGTTVATCSSGTGNEATCESSRGNGKSDGDGSEHRELRSGREWRRRVGGSG